MTNIWAGAAAAEWGLDIFGHSISFRSERDHSPKETAHVGVLRHGRHSFFLASLPVVIPPLEQLSPPISLTRHHHRALVAQGRERSRRRMPPLTPPKSGDALFASVERVNAELFTLTYGAIVRQLLTDLEEVEEVNKQLDQMGYNIGTRLVDEFLAKSNVSNCVDFKETADTIAKLGFKMFLGVTATVTNWDAEGTTCSFVLEDNPLVDFVELPDTYQGLQYCNVLSGVIRGALEMVSMKTEVTWVRDMLRGDDAYEMRVKLTKQVPEEYPYKDDD